VSAHPIGEAATAASYFVRSLERGLAVIGVLDAPEPLSLSEVARRTGLSRAAARRFVLTLEHLGYVRQSGGRFALTPRVLELRTSRRSSSRCANPRSSRCATTTPSSASPAFRRGGS